MARKDQNGQAPAQGADVLLAEELVARARSEGLRLTGPDGLLGRVTKAVLEGALRGEMDDHLGYVKHDAAEIVGKRQRWLCGIDELVISLAAKGPDHRRGGRAAGRGVRRAGVPPDDLDDH